MPLTVAMHWFHVEKPQFDAPPPKRRRLRQDCRRQRERGEYDCSNSHRKSPFVVVPGQQHVSSPHPGGCASAFQKTRERPNSVHSRASGNPEGNKSGRRHVLGPRFRGDERERVTQSHVRPSTTTNG